MTFIVRKMPFLHKILKRNGLSWLHFICKFNFSASNALAMLTFTVRKSSEIDVCENFAGFYVFHDNEVVILLVLYLRYIFHVDLSNQNELICWNLIWGRKVTWLGCLLVVCMWRDLWSGLIFGKVAVTCFHLTSRGKWHFKVILNHGLKENIPKFSPHCL